MGRFADALIKELDATRQWPLQREREALIKVALARAFRETDREYLMAAHPEWDQKRRYLVDPLATDISDAYSSLLFGNAPIIRGAEGDQARWDTWVRDNDLPATLQREEAIVSSEGEVWWRLLVSEDLAQVMLHWYSRGAVIPYWVGKRHLRAIAFVDPLDKIEGTDFVYRHLEIHDDEAVVNVLYEGTDDSLGNQVSLEAHPDTEDLDEDWEHGLGEMLAGRIINKAGSDPTMPYGDFHDIQDQLWALNEAMTIGAENAKLTLKKRVVVDEDMVDASGNIPAGMEALVVTSDDEGMDGVKDTGSRFKVLEYTFNADELAKYQRNLAEIACTRSGISLVFVGADSEQGRADTGTALRVRLLPTINAGELRAGAWDTHFVTPLALVPRLASLPVDDGGLGQTWLSTDEPTFTRGASLHEDPVERQERVARGKESGTMSAFQAVRELHPTWTDQQVQDEVDQIHKDSATANPMARVLGNGTGT